MSSKWKTEKKSDENMKWIKKMAKESFMYGKLKYRIPFANKTFHYHLSVINIYACFRTMYI